MGDITVGEIQIELNKLSKVKLIKAVKLSDDLEKSLDKVSGIAKDLVARYEDIKENGSKAQGDSFNAFGQWYNERVDPLRPDDGDGGDPSDDTGDGDDAGDGNDPADGNDGSGDSEESTVAASTKKKPAKGKAAKKPAKAANTDAAKGKTSAKKPAAAKAGTKKPAKEKSGVDVFGFRIGSLSNQFGQAILKAKNGLTMDECRKATWNPKGWHFNKQFHACAHNGLMKRDKESGKITATDKARKPPKAA